MAITYGFYNSLNGDRRYNAEQLSSIFDGMVTDGVFSSIGKFLSVTPVSGMTVKVAPGKAWFNHTWTINDSDYPINIAASDPSLKRIDAVVLRVNASDSARENSIMVLKGTPSSNPVKPSMTNTEFIHDHALAYITVKGGATSLTASDIQIVVGTSETPFVTAILQQATIDSLFQNWNSEFNTWFSNLKAQLTDNVVTNLQKQIDELKNKDTTLETSLKTLTSNFNSFSEGLSFNLVFEKTTAGAGIFSSDKNQLGFAILIGGGGGGGGGAANNTTNAEGTSALGGGGGGGGMALITPLIPLTKNMPYVVGSGGKGGEKATTKGNVEGVVAGTNGERGGSTTFSEYIAFGGSYGLAGKYATSSYYGGSNGGGAGGRNDDETPILLPILSIPGINGGNGGVSGVDLVNGLDAEYSPDTIGQIFPNLLDIGGGGGGGGGARAASSTSNRLSGSAGKGIKGGGNGGAGRGSYVSGTLSASNGANGKTGCGGGGGGAVVRYYTSTSTSAVNAGSGGNGGDGALYIYTLTTGD